MASKLCVLVVLCCLLVYAGIAWAATAVLATLAPWHALAGGIVALCGALGLLRLVRKGE